MSDSRTEVELAVMRRQLDDMDHELFGNGQPGRLDKTDAKINEMDQRIDKRLSTMEERVTKIIIAVSLIAQAGGQAVPFVVELLKGL